MALKDWKRVLNHTKYGINFQHKKYKFHGLFYSIGIIPIDNEYEVFTYPPKKQHNKYFKTKSQALKFARAYMRTH